MRLDVSIALGVALLSLAAGACSGSAGGAGACPPNGVVPPDLRDVERAGEGLVNTTFGSYPDRTPDWQAAASVLSLLHEVWGRTKMACPDLPADQSKAIDDAVAQLDTSVPAQDQKAAATAANAVGLAVPALFAYFGPDIPIEVVRMDASFRQVGLDAHFGDWSGVAKDTASLSADWMTSKGPVGQRAPTCHRVGGTSTVAGDIDQSLADLTNAIPAQDAATAEKVSDDGALEIDTLELLFDCPPDGAPPASGLGSKCQATTDCGMGEVCDTANAGGTCAPDPSLAAVGTPCMTTIECGTDPRSACLNAAGDGYPGGYCGMEPCDDVQVCSAGATCVSQPHETPGCFKSCTTDADCRTIEGYVCQLYPTTPPIGFGPSDHACGFPCKDDAGCTGPLLCDTATGKCKP